MQTRLAWPAGGRGEASKTRACPKKGENDAQAQEVKKKSSLSSKPTGEKAFRRDPRSHFNWEAPAVFGPPAYSQRSPGGEKGKEENSPLPDIAETAHGEKEELTFPKRFATLTGRKGEPATRGKTSSWVNTGEGHAFIGRQRCFAENGKKRRRVLAKRLERGDSFSSQRLRCGGRSRGQI